MLPRTWPTFLLLWLRVGCLSFGGPAGQIALMHRELVERLRLLDDAAYTRALGLCTLLPGPEAQQLATWCGWRLRGVTGGLAAGLLFVAPGAVVMAALTALYIGYGRAPLLAAALFGVQAAVLAIVGHALVRMARRSLDGPLAWALAIGALVAIAAAGVPFPLVVLAAGLIGWGFGRRPQATAAPASPVGWSATLRTAIGWAAVWAAPVLLAALLLGADHPLVTLGAFFAKMAAVTFGGAYAALAWVAQEAVSQHGWLSARDMLAGLGLAETTPGPLVLVFQFVGGLAGQGMNGPWSAPWVGAALGMGMVLWVTFAPSFLWIFTLAPHLDRLAGRPALAAALSGITAAVVGVIASLALFVARHVLVEPVGIAVAAGAALLLWRGVGLVSVVLLAAAGGAALGYAGVAVPI